MPLNPILIQQVKQALAAKRAFVPPGGGDPAAMGAAGGAPPMDPSMAGAAGGAPPMDPSMMAAMGGGAPPMDPSMMGGAPPMDPSMMGGAPPMDPAAMGGAPPAPPAPTPTSGGGTSEEIKALIQAEIQKAMSGGGAGGGDGKPKGKGAGKVDPAQMIEYMDRQQKLLINLYESLGLSLPYDILDKPKADGEGEAKQEAPKEQKSETNVSGIPEIKPIEPIGGKQASLVEKAQAARYLLQAVNKKG